MLVLSSFLICYHNKQHRFEDRFSGQLKTTLASIRILLFRWGSLIEPGLSVLWALLSSIIVADKSKEEMYMVFVTKVMNKLCNTGTHSITIGSISSKAWPPGSFAINLRPQASSKEVLRLRKVFTPPLLNFEFIHNIQEQYCSACKESTFYDWEGKSSNNQMNILLIAFSQALGCA